MRFRADPGEFPWRPPRPESRAPGVLRILSGGVWDFARCHWLPVIRLVQRDRSRQPVRSPRRADISARFKNGDSPPSPRWMATAKTHSREATAPKIGMVQKRGQAPSQLSTTTQKTGSGEVPVPVFEPCPKMRRSTGVPPVTGHGRDGHATRSWARCPCYGGSRPRWPCYEPPSFSSSTGGPKVHDREDSNCSDPNNHRACSRLGRMGARWSCHSRLLDRLGG